MRSGSRLISAMCLAVMIAAAGCSSGGGDPERPRSQLQFGVRAAQIELWREARFRFERAVQLDPMSTAALNNLAVAQEGTGEFEQAKETYLKALKIDPSNTYIQKNYSRFSEFYNRYQKAGEKDGDAKDGKKPPEGKPTAPPAKPKGGRP